MSQGLDLVSLAGEYLTATTNTNMFTYEIAPVYNLMEEVTLKKMRELIGWKEPGDGILSPGIIFKKIFAIIKKTIYFFKKAALYQIYMPFKQLDIIIIQKLKKMDCLMHQDWLLLPLSM